MTKEDEKNLSDIGGECTHCGEEDNWSTISRDKVEDAEYDYSYQLQCMTETEDGICGNEVEKTICEEPEYDKENDPNFFDDSDDLV